MAAIAFPTGLATRCLPFFIFSVPFAHAASETTLAPVRVYAEQSDFDERQTSATTRLVYGREELDRIKELTVGDYLCELPGVTFTGPPGSPKDVRLRGGEKIRKDK